MRAAKVQASLRIRAVSPEPSLLAHTSSESRGTFRQKTRSLAPLNRRGGGHIVCGADPVGVGVSVGVDVSVGVTLSCLHYIS